MDAEIEIVEAIIEHYKELRETICSKINALDKRIQEEIILKFKLFNKINQGMNSTQICSQSNIRGY